jgi:hypothetical protein
MRRSAALSVLTCACQRAPPTAEPRRPIVRPRRARRRHLPTRCAIAHRAVRLATRPVSRRCRATCTPARSEPRPARRRGSVAPHEHGRNGNRRHATRRRAHVVARSVGLTPGGSFTLGTADDFRVPDLGFHRDPTPHSYYPTAALVIEIMSPRDETRAGGALAPSVTARREPDAAARRAGPSPAWQLGGARSGDCTVGRPLWPRIRTCRRG